jgi:hypothetical protein
MANAFCQGLGTFITVNLNWEFSTDMADLRHVMSIPFFITRIGWPVRKETSDARRLPFVGQNRLSFLSISPRPSLRDTPQGIPTQQRSQHRQFVTAQPDCSIKTPYDKVLITKTRAVEFLSSQSGHSPTYSHRITHPLTINEEEIQ